MPLFQLPCALTANGVKTTDIILPVRTERLPIIPNPVTETKATQNAPRSNGAGTKDITKRLNPVMISDRHGIPKTNARTVWTCINPVLKTGPGLVRTTVMSTTVIVRTRRRFANGTAPMRNAATIRNQTDVRRIPKSRAVKAERLSEKTAAVMTAINAARLPVRRDMLIPMKKPRAGRADISKTWRMKMIIVCTAQKASFISGKKIRARDMTFVRLMAGLTTGITATAEI